MHTRKLDENIISTSIHYVYLGGDNEKQYSPHNDSKTINRKNMNNTRRVQQPYLPAAV